MSFVGKREPKGSLESYTDVISTTAHDIATTDPPVQGSVVATMSFAAFYEDSRDQIARALAITLGDPDLAAEATDEAMARGYQRWDSISGYDAPAGWVYRVGLNWARSALRRRRRDRSTLYGPQATSELPTPVDPAVHEALGRLSVKLRAVVVCRCLLDWSVEQTAVALDIREGTVKSRLSRALEQLETHLKDHDETGRTH